MRRRMPNVSHVLCPGDHQSQWPFFLLFHRAAADTEPVWEATSMPASEETAISLVFAPTSCDSIVACRQLITESVGGKH